MSKMMELWSKPLIVTAVTMGLAFAMGETGSVVVPVVNTGVPLWVLYGAIAYPTSLVTVSVSEYLLPHIPGNKRYSSIEGALIQPAVHGLINGVAFGALTGMIWDPVKIGIGAELVGGYISENFVNPM